MYYFVYYNHNDINHNCDTNTYKITKHRWTLLFQVGTVYKFLTSVHGDSKREAQFLKVYANHTILTPAPRTVHFVMFKILIHLCRSRSEKPNYIFTVKIKLYVSTVPSQLTFFFKILKFSRPSFPGMMLSQLLSHSLCGCLLWQWWLSYPFHASIKLHPTNMHLY